MQREIEQLGHRLANAYTAVKAATQGLFEASAQVLVEKKRQTEARQEIVNHFADDPKALGGNEAARAARLAEMTADQSARVESAELMERVARNRLELGRLELEAARAELRVLELAAKVREEATC